MKSRADNLKTRLLLIVTAFLCIQFSGFGQVVDIPDPELQRKIRRALEIPVGDITVGDMESLTELTFSRTSRPITSFEGLEAAKNLSSLNLSGWSLPGGDSFSPLGTRDLSSLKNIANLTTLDLSHNDLTDVSFLEGFSNLTTLDLYENQLTSLTLPEGLNSLTTLNLSQNRLTDFSFLEGLSGLKNLVLDGNQLTRMNLPTGLTSLTTLDLHDNQLTDFSFLEGLSTLKTLRLYDNQLTSINLPEGLTNLTSLVLHSNQLTDLSFLEGLTSLTSLVLSNNRLTDASFLEGFTSLTDLDLRDNELTSLTLSELPMLANLDLRGNPLTSLTLTEGLESLRTLWVSPEAVRDFSPLLDRLLLSDVRVGSDQSIPRRIIRDENGHVSISFIPGRFGAIRILRSTDMIIWEPVEYYWRCNRENGLFKDESVTGLDFVFYRFEDESGPDTKGGCGLGF